MNNAITNLRVANKHDLGVRAPLVQVAHGTNDSGSALLGRAVVAGTPAAALTTASRVRNSLSSSSRVSLLHHLDESLRCTIPRRGCCLPGAKDVDCWAGLPLLDVQRSSPGEGGQDQCCASHSDRGVVSVKRICEEFRLVNQRPNANISQADVGVICCL